MIPQGVFNQDSRDLSKEIWISWGYGYSQEQGVFVNSFGPQDINYSHILKNAKGEDTTFRYLLADYQYYGVYAQYYESGVLDIINRCEIQIENYIDDVEWFMTQWIELSSSVPTPVVAVYVLGPRQANPQYELAFEGWLPTGITAIPQNVSYPVQTKMEVTSDWFEVGKNTASSVARIGHSWDEVEAYGRIRAIVIKLL